MQTAKLAEREVERHRVDLEHTLSDLRNNLKPANLMQEALSGGHWFTQVQTFARTSPISWAIMTAAAVGIGIQASRRTLR